MCSGIHSFWHDKGFVQQQPLSQAPIEIILPCRSCVHFAAGLTHSVAAMAMFTEASSFCEVFGCNSTLNNRHIFFLTTLGYPPSAAGFHAMHARVLFCVVVKYCTGVCSGAVDW